MDDYLHSNENYVVYATEDAIEVGGVLYTESYAVANVQTEVHEHLCPSLPEAIHVAEQYNHALVNKAWEWRDAKGSTH